MNRVVVGTAPSPNLWNTRARVGSLANSAHRPGGGQVGAGGTTIYILQANVDSL